MIEVNRRRFLQGSMLVGGGLSLPGCTQTAAFSGAAGGVDLSGGIDPEREFVLAERPSIRGMRDAVNVWIEEKNARFAMRIGVEALAEKWDNQLVWLDLAYPDGRIFNLRDENGKTHSPFDDNGQPTVRGSGGVQFRCVEPFKHWKVTYKGMVPETSAKNLINKVWPDQPPMVPLEFEIDMHMAVPPWAPGSLLKKGDEVMEGEQGDFISPRYEQLFRCYGVVRVDGQTDRFEGNGLRIRRTGVRKFKGFWGHCWQSAVFPDGRGFGFNTFPPRADGKPSYNEGYVFDGSGVLKPARAVKIPWIDELNTSGDDVSCVLETEDGLVSIKGETFINLRSRAPGQLPPEFPIVQQAHARYWWDGEETVGMVERSSLPGVFKHPVA